MKHNECWTIITNTLFGTQQSPGKSFMSSNEDLSGPFTCSSGFRRTGAPLQIQSPLSIPCKKDCLERLLVALKIDLIPVKVFLNTILHLEV